MNTPPAFLPVRADNILHEMKDLARWVDWLPVWQVNRAGIGKWTKVPKQPNGKSASTTDPSTWSTFGAAFAAYLTGCFDGVGWVLRPPYTGIDFDTCFDPDGNVQPDVLTWVRRLDSYTERSVSRTGLHVLTKTTLPPFGHKLGPFEAYNHGRYFTVSGHRWPGV